MSIIVRVQAIKDMLETIPETDTKQRAWVRQKLQAARNEMMRDARRSWMYS